MSNNLNPASAQVSKSDLHELEKSLAALAERRRNEALGIFAGFALLLSLLGYFGLQQIARIEMTELAESEILRVAKSARAEAEQSALAAASASTSANQFLADLKDKGAIPPGVVVAWFPPQEDLPLSDLVPKGWVLCDGNNGAPDLTGRFIMGTFDSATIVSTGGSSKHGHSASKTGTRFEATNQGSRGTGATRHDDNHIVVNEVETLPPYVALAYIMKLP